MATARSFGPAHPQVAGALNLLGIILHYRNRLGEAEKALSDALELWTTGQG